MWHSNARWRNCFMVLMNKRAYEEEAARHVTVKPAVMGSNTERGGGGGIIRPPEHPSFANSATRCSGWCNSLLASSRASQQSKQGNAPGMQLLFDSSLSALAPWEAPLGGANLVIIITTKCSSLRHWGASQRFPVRKAVLLVAKGRPT